jgi:hypothetical protein
LGNTYPFFGLVVLLRAVYNDPLPDLHPSYTDPDHHPYRNSLDPDQHTDPN